MFVSVSVQTDKIFTEGEICVHYRRREKRLLFWFVAGSTVFTAFSKLQVLTRLGTTARRWVNLLRLRGRLPFNVVTSSVFVFVSSAVILDTKEAWKIFVVEKTPGMATTQTKNRTMKEMANMVKNW